MTLKNNCQILNIFHWELYFTFNVFVFSINTTVFLLINKGRFNIFFLPIQIQYFYIQLPVLGGLLGHRAFC